MPRPTSRRRRRWTATTRGIPDDRARARDIRERLDAEDVRLPGGDRLTGRRFSQLGMWLGDSAGFELLHHVLELPFGSAAFLHDVERAVGWARNPIYATLHESSYADGVATRWSASRLLPDRFREPDAFTAEHVFPWMWEDYAGLHGHREAANAARRARVAAPVRRGPARPQRGPGRRDDLHQRRVRGA